MNQIEFIESDKTEKLWEDGYVTFPFLSNEKVGKLSEIFHQFHDDVPEGFYASTHLEDVNLRKKMSDAAVEIIESELPKWLKNEWLLGGAFISKSPGEKGILPLHQDWNLVDESKERSYNLWIPLVDVNEVNGAMRILPKSHRKQSTIRGPQIPPVLYSISQEVDEHMQSLNLKAGEAVLYDHALWHSSPTNRTNELRLALVMGMVPKNAELRYYEMNDGIIVEYASHPHFFMENNRNDGPKNLTKIKDIKSENKQLSVSEFHEIYLEKKEKEQKSNYLQSLLNRIFQ